MRSPAAHVVEPARADDQGVLAVVGWWVENARELPWRATRDVYGIWVSEVMCSQTPATRAAAAWTRWMALWPSVEDLAGASLAEVLAQWQGLGYPRRARDLHRSARMVAESGWPDDLTDLPGVGTYIACAVRCFAHEEPVLPLDVNVKRVIRRRFPAGVDPSGDPWQTGQALMEFGQRICTSRPRCARCPAASGCPAAGSAQDEPPVRRQAPYRGSLRERRGRLLRRVLTQGAVRADDEDAQAAAGLVQDGLLIARDGMLLAPV